MSHLETDIEQFFQSGDFLGFTSKNEKTFPENPPICVHQTTIQLLDTGVLLVEPQVASSTSKKDVLISSGIHGNETAPIEIVNQLVGEIIQGKTTVQNRTLFIIGNPVAMNQSKRFQDENLNRLFCGQFEKVLATYEGQRAKNLEKYVTQFFNNSNSPASERYHYDLHTAIRGSKYEKFAVYPFREDQCWDKGQLEFLQASGVNTILFSHAPSGTFSYYTSSTFDAHAFTVELGQVRPFGENDMEKFRSITANLRHLIQGEEPPTEVFDNAQFQLFEVLGEITKNSDAFQLNIAEDVKNFTDFPIGMVLSEDGTERHIIQQEGESIVFPNSKVKNGQRAGLIVVPTSL